MKIDVARIRSRRRHPGVRLAAICAAMTAVASVLPAVLAQPVFAGANDLSSFLEEVNHPPISAADAYATNAGTALTVAAPGVLGNDSDPDSDALTALLFTGPTQGTLTLNADGSFTYTPASGFVGVDSFTYAALDGKGAVGAPAVVTITVGAVDGDGDGIPDTQDPDTVGATVSALPAGVFATGEHRQPILNRLDAIEQLIAAGDLAGARSELESLRRKVDGCGTAADTNDWIVDCSAQLEVRARVELPGYGTLTAADAQCVPSPTHGC